MVEVAGQFDFKLFGRDGALVRQWSCPNGVTYDGMSYMLEAGFLGSSPLTSWQIGLIDGGGSPALSINDTMDSHAGWDENTDYASYPVRPAWLAINEGNATAVNALAAASFVMTSDATIYGSFLVSSSGVLYSTCEFYEGPQVVTDGQVLLVLYTASIIPM
jgi:hypothetical protein